MRTYPTATEALRETLADTWAILQGAGPIILSVCALAAVPIALLAMALASRGS